MSTRTHRGVKRFRRDDKAAVSIMGAFWVSGVAALTGLTVDLSQVWTAQSALQSSSDAAALAAAYDLYNSTTVTQATFEASAKAYSALSTGSNANSALTNVSITITPTCFANTGLSCSTSYTTTATTSTPSTTSSINGVKISQSATVKLYFGGLLGISTKTITATAAAQSRNGISVTSAGTISPLDTVVIVDTTASMGSSGSDSCTLPSGGTGTTSIACALGGVQTLLKTLNPCDATLGCGTVTNGVATNPQSRVALMVFPPLSTAYDASGTTEQSKDYDCGTTASNPSTVKYNSTTIYPSGAWSSTAYKNYLVLPFQSDYRSANSDTTLNNSSNIVKAVGGSTTCSNGAVGTPGGSGSYGADALRAAKEYLAASGRTGATKAIIIFSDGGYQTSYAPGVSNGTTTPTTNYGAAATTTNGSMAASQCQAAIAAAQNAKDAGISVYSLAYNASTSSSGCTDGTALAKGTAASTAWSTNTSPCTMMNKIATSDSYFFSNDKNGNCKNSTVSANNVSTSNSTAFTTLFSGIASSLNASITNSGSTTTRPRLIKYSST